MQHYAFLRRPETAARTWWLAWPLCVVAIPFDYAQGTNGFYKQMTLCVTSGLKSNGKQQPNLFGAKLIWQFADSLYINEYGAALRLRSGNTPSKQLGRSMV